MTSPPDKSDSMGIHEASRRDKLRKIVEMGIDPWGGRFENRSLIADIRARDAEVRYRLESGEEIDLPAIEPESDTDLRAWKAEQGKGEVVGPQVRAAGRVVFLRPTGKLIFINISPVRVAPTEKTGLLQLGMKEFKLIKLLEAIRSGIHAVKARRVIIDPVTLFMLQYPDETERIHAMRDLITELRRTRCTHLLISELRGTGFEREYQFEEYLAQGVILLRTILKDDKIIRMFQAEKMRGLEIDTQPRPYNITKSGIEVYPNLTVFR